MYELSELTGRSDENNGWQTYREWLPPVEEDDAVDEGEEDVVQERLRCRRVDA